MSEYESPFYDLGYATPEEAEEFHAAHGAGQGIDSVTRAQQRRAHRRRRSYNVQDYENDGDHAEAMAAIPPGEELPEENEPQLALFSEGQLAVRAIVHDLKVARIKAETADDLVLQRARLRAYEARHHKTTA